jgi:hypothetical protein
VGNTHTVSSALDAYRELEEQKRLAEIRGEPAPTGWLLVHVCVHVCVCVCARVRMYVCV